MTRPVVSVLQPGLPLPAPGPPRPGAAPPDAANAFAALIDKGSQSAAHGGERRAPLPDPAEPPGDNAPAQNRAATNAVAVRSTADDAPPPPHPPAPRKIPPSAAGAAHSPRGRAAAGLEPTDPSPDDNKRDRADSAAMFALLPVPVPPARMKADGASAGAVASQGSEYGQIPWGAVGDGAEFRSIPSLARNEVSSEQSFRPLSRVTSSPSTPALDARPSVTRTGGEDQPASRPDAAAAYPTSAVSTQQPRGDASHVSPPERSPIRTASSDAPLPGAAIAAATAVSSQTHLAPPDPSPSAQIANALLPAIGDESAASTAPAASPSAFLPSPSNEKLRTLVLDLHPDRLGPVQVRLRLLGGELHVGILAQSRDTTEILDLARAELSDRIAEAGYRLSALDIATATGSAAETLPRDKAYPSQTDSFDDTQHRGSGDGGMRDGATNEGRRRAPSGEPDKPRRAPRASRDLRL